MKKPVAISVLGSSTTATEDRWCLKDGGKLVKSSLTGEITRTGGADKRGSAANGHRNCVRAQRVSGSAFLPAPRGDGCTSVLTEEPVGRLRESYEQSILITARKSNVCSACSPYRPISACTPFRYRNKRERTKTFFFTCLRMVRTLQPVAQA